MRAFRLCGLVLDLLPRALGLPRISSCPIICASSTAREHFSSPNDSRMTADTVSPRVCSAGGSPSRRPAATYAGAGLDVGR